MVRFRQSPRLNPPVDDGGPSAHSCVNPPATGSGGSADSSPDFVPSVVTSAPSEFDPGVQTPSDHENPEADSALGYAQRPARPPRRRPTFDVEPIEARGDRSERRDVRGPVSDSRDPAHGES